MVRNSLIHQSRYWKSWRRKFILCFTWPEGFFFKPLFKVRHEHFTFCSFNFFMLFLCLLFWMGFPWNTIERTLYNYRTIVADGKGNVAIHAMGNNHPALVCPGVCLDIQAELRRESHTWRFTFRAVHGSVHGLHAIRLLSICRYRLVWLAPGSSAPSQRGWALVSSWP